MRKGNKEMGTGWWIVVVARVRVPVFSTGAGPLQMSRPRLTLSTL